jgi:ABC-type sugar transport system substrate-binding protein
MKRLVRQAKPRPKKKELKLTTKFVFETFTDEEEEAKADLKRFKMWMRDVFPDWADAILREFLYAYNLCQDSEDHKYLLSVNLDKVVKDESVIKDERKLLDTELEEISDDAEKKLKDKEKELFK